MNASDRSARHGEAASPGLLALVEIERFEGLRRTIGHVAAGDALSSLAERIQAYLGSDASISVQRALIEVQLRGGSAVIGDAQLEHMVETLSSRIDVDGFGFDLSFRIGAMPYLPGQRYADHLGLAERALTAARASSTRVHVLQPSAEGVVDRLSLLRRLQRAVADDALTLHYQPKIAARTGAVIGVEALLRWHCPVAGNIPPDRFIPITEETGDIRALTEWVIARAVADQRHLASVGHPALRVEVNMAAGLFDDARLIARLIDEVAPTGRIGFEITENTTVTDRPDVLANLNLCAEAGVRLAIDDYGAGVSSLAYLQQLPVDELKIDRSFISRLTSQQRDPLLVRSTIDLAHALDMEVTAEGVDSPHALALLQVMGCDLLQGFYLSRPLPLPALLDYLADDATRTALVRPTLLTPRIKRGTA